MTKTDTLPPQMAEYEERRAKKRFPVEQDIRYRVLLGQQVRDICAAKTINMSSGGVCFTTDRYIPIGMEVELSISWPVLLRDSCPMKLMIRGCVIRSSVEAAVLEIGRYEFRTQGTHGLHQSLRGAQPWEVCHGINDRGINCSVVN
jgi:hypothetical protein